MIQQPFEQISLLDLQGLIDNDIRESKTIEYKRDLPGNSDGDKNSFLSAVSSLANTEGGDLIYGVEAKEGSPKELTGIDRDQETDKIKLRLEQMCRSGLDPKLPKIEMSFISQPDKGPILVIRVAKSWNSPHRVIANGGAHFYGRHSAGKFQMDVAELRTAFTLSDKVADRINNFHHERLSAIHSHHTPVPIALGCKMALHIVPLSAFASSEKIDIVKHHQALKSFLPIGRDSVGISSKISLDGVVNFSNLVQDRSAAYTQIYRSGVVESVYVWKKDHAVIGVTHCENILIKALHQYRLLLKHIELVPPFYLFLSFIGATHFEFAISTEEFGSAYYPAKADREFIVVPEIVITDHDITTEALLKPVFDMMWNSFGYPASQNYDAHGNRIARQR